MVLTERAKALRPFIQAALDEGGVDVNGTSPRSVTI